VDENAEFYYIFKKTKEDDFWTDTIAILPGNASEFTDLNIQKGEAFEYGFYKTLISSHDTLDVENGKKLTFRITDSWGDGICCHHGLGSYIVKGKDTTYISGGAFGAEEIKHFIVKTSNNLTTDEIVITINQDVFPLETQWQLTDAESNQVLASGGPYLPHQFGHIYAGINVPAKEVMGTVLLVIDNVLKDDLEFEINRLKVDLICDGWQVKSIYVNRNDQVTKVKSMIITEYENDNSINSVLLLGHIPVPYSGNLVSAHTDHMGAYPADVYYAELADVWTDSLVTNTTASREANHNVPGDGKFDRTFLESDVDLCLGRVDLSNLGSFSETEIELYRNYLYKNHSFRTGIYDIEERGLVDDNVGELGGMAPAAIAFRNFTVMFGADKIYELDYFSTLKERSFLWSYGCGGGSYVSCNGVGTSSSFSTYYVQSVFTMLYGSYFGDWDNPDNILRAPLASEGNVLTNVWAGAPTWHFHHMALGETIGYSTRVTQNNKSVYAPSDKARQVHIALMGDPTLKMHIVKPPYELEIYQINNTIQLNWTASQDIVTGYYIYRTDSIHHRFDRINNEPIVGLSYTDSFPLNGNNIYMLRALKCEKSSSGTYYNLSNGVIDSLIFFQSTFIPEKELKPGSFIIQNFPNPLRESMQVSFNITERTNVMLSFYTLDMKIIDVIDFGVFEQGVHTIQWIAQDASGQELSNGIYLYQLKTEKFCSAIKSMIIIK